MIRFSFIAPTVLIDSGQRSLTSITQGVFFQKLNVLPESAVKNCGEVATIMSDFTFWKIWRTRYYSDLNTLFYPLDTMFVSTGCRSINFGREIIGKEKYFHF